MSRFDDAELKVNVLLELFKDKMVTELTEHAIAAIRPDIERAAVAAVNALKPQAEMHFNQMAQKLVLTLSGEKVHEV